MKQKVPASDRHFLFYWLNVVLITKEKESRAANKKDDFYSCNFIIVLAHIQMKMKK